MGRFITADTGLGAVSIAAAGLCCVVPASGPTVFAFSGVEPRPSKGETTTKASESPTSAVGIGGEESVSTAAVLVRESGLENRKVAA